MRAFELSPRPPFPEPGKVQTRSFWSFQPAKSSKCARLNFPQGRPSLSLEKFNRTHFGVFSPLKAQNARVRTFPKAALPRAWKSSNALILEFSARYKLKMRTFELSSRPPFPEPGKVQTRSFWSFQPAKSSKCARLNFPQGRPSPSLEKFKRAHFGVFSPLQAQNARV